MSITHSWTFSLQKDSATITQKVTDTADVASELDVVVPNGAANQSASLSIVAAKLKSLLILSTMNITLKTNSATTPGNTFNLVANIPLIWTADGGYFANPLSADVTAVFLSNSAGAQATVKVRAASTA